MAKMGSGHGLGHNSIDNIGSLCSHLWLAQLAYTGSGNDMIKLIKLIVSIATVIVLANTAYNWWVSNSAISCAEDTIEAGGEYTEEFLAFTEAEDMYWDALEQWGANPTDSLEKHSVQVHENMMAVWADSREKIAAIEAPTCLENVREETIDGMGGPVSAASDLRNFAAAVLRYQRTLLTVMDSAYECHQTYEDAVCDKYVADAIAIDQIRARIRAIQEKFMPETE